MSSEQIVIATEFNAPVEKIWAAITDINQMKEWYFPMLEQFTPEIGFQTQFSVLHEGQDFIHIWKVTEVLAEKKISYEWKYAGFPGCSLLSFELFPQGGKAKLVLTHSKLETFIPDANPLLAKEQFEVGWDQLIRKQLNEFLEKDQ